MLASLVESLDKRLQEANRAAVAADAAAASSSSSSAAAVAAAAANSALFDVLLPLLPQLQEADAVQHDVDCATVARNQQTLQRQIKEHREAQEKAQAAERAQKILQWEKQLAQLEKQLVEKDVLLAQVAESVSSTVLDFIAHGDYRGLSQWLKSLAQKPAVGSLAQHMLSRSRSPKPPKRMRPFSTFD
jgi:hypothetical protein